MCMNISKNYTVRVHYLDVKSNKTDFFDLMDVELKDVLKNIKASISAIIVGSEILDRSFIISKIEVELNK